MKVKAKFAHGKFGFYGGERRYDGDEFELEDKKHFSEKWMIEVKAKPGRKKADPVVENEAEAGGE